MEEAISSRTEGVVTVRCGERSGDFGEDVVIVSLCVYERAAIVETRGSASRCRQPPFIDCAYHNGLRSAL